MIYALLDRAKNGYFRFYVHHPKEPREIVYKRWIFFDANTMRSRNR